MDSSQKAQSDKHVRVAPAYATLVLIVGFGLFLYPVISGFNSNTLRQKSKVESLAYQILEIRKKMGPSGRSPASEMGSFEGKIGQAADGKPYSYRIDEKDSKWVVSVWSESNPQDLTEVRINKDPL